MDTYSGPCQNQEPGIPFKAPTLAVATAQALRPSAAAAFHNTLAGNWIESEAAKDSNWWSFGMLASQRAL